MIPDRPNTNENYILAWLPGVLFYRLLAILKSVIRNGYDIMCLNKQAHQVNWFLKLRKCPEKEKQHSFQAVQEILSFLKVAYSVSASNFS